MLRKLKVITIIGSLPHTAFRARLRAIDGCGAPNLLEGVKVLTSSPYVSFSSNAKSQAFASHVLLIDNSCISPFSFDDTSDGGVSLLRKRKRKSPTWDVSCVCSLLHTRISSTRVHTHREGQCQFESKSQDPTRTAARDDMKRKSSSGCSS